MRYILKLTDDAIEDVESFKKAGDKAALKRLAGYPTGRTDRTSPVRK